MIFKVKVSDYKPPKTMTRDELKRLEFCNSKKLPKKIRVGGKNGKTLEWVGFCWVECSPTPDAVIIT